MSADPAPDGKRSLSQLSGGLLCLYYGLWFTLAAGAVAAAALIWFGRQIDPAILSLRMLKTAVLLTVGIILLRRRGRDPVAALLSLALLTWAITSSFDFGTRALVPQLLDRCRFILFALALLLFPNGEWQPHWTRVLAGFCGAVFLVGLAETSGLLPTRIFLPLAIACILGSIAGLVYRFRAAGSYAVRQQLKWVALGLSGGVGLILVARAGASLSAPVFASGTAILWEAFFQLGVIAVALGFLVSLLRYRLFDAETVISRSAAYAVLTIALVATFGGTEAIIQNLGQSYLGMNIGGVSGAMAAAVAAVLLNPLHERITGWAEDRFQPDLAQLKRDVPQLLARLSAGSSTRQLAAAILPHIALAVHAVSSAFSVNGRILACTGMKPREARDWQHMAELSNASMPARDCSDTIFPIRLAIGGPQRAEAWLLLGPRPDGTLYGREDMAALLSLFPALRGALRSAAERESVGAKIRAHRKRVRKDILELSSRLQLLESLLIAVPADPRECRPRICLVKGT